MTEPPEPRRPEEGGGEEETNWLAEVDDDMLIDQLGSGDDVEDGSELADMLGAWRDDVDSVPPPPGTAPETVQQIHDFAQEIDRATTPPRSTEGSTPAMPNIQEVIAVLTQVAADNSAIGPLQQASEALNSTVLPSVMQAVEQLAGMVGTAAQSLEGHADAQQSVQGAGEHAANAIEDAIELVQNAIVGVSQAQDHTGAFQSVVSEAASRVQGG